VSEKSNREVVERYAKAHVDHDYGVMDELRHADYVCEYPRSGDRGDDGRRRSLGHHVPGRQRSLAPGEHHRAPRRKVVKETTIFGAAFDAPEWRAQWSVPSTLHG